MINVLIIEDKYSIAEEVKYLIEVNFPNSINIIEIAEDETEAKYFLKQNHFHLIFWDIDLKGNMSYALAREFPSINSYILLFSDDEHALKYLLRNENLTHLKLDLDYFEDDKKTTLNKLADSSELHKILKSKIHIDNAKILKIHVQNAIDKYGSRIVALLNYDNKDASVRLLDIVMITTVDNYKFKFEPVNRKEKPLGDRKAIFRKKDFFITNGALNLKTLDSVLEKVLENHKFFIRVNQSTIINVNQVIQSKLNENSDLVIELNLQINKPFVGESVSVIFDTRYVTITIPQLIDNRSNEYYEPSVNAIISYQ